MGRKRSRLSDRQRLSVFYRQHDLVLERVDTHCLKYKVVVLVVVEPSNLQISVCY